MAATRLALSMDESVVERARRLAEARNTSISKLFVSFVCIMEQQKDADWHELPPLTKKALGLARGRVVTSLPPVCPPPPLSLRSGWQGAPCRLKRKTLSLAGLPVRDCVCSPLRCDHSRALSEVPPFAGP